MFIKLTRTDGRPIWINPEFVVTVEDRKGGGAIVVPAGDGLDYDVRESPDAVMRMCGGVAAAAPQTSMPAEQPTEGSAAQPEAEPADGPPAHDAPAVAVAQAETTVLALRESVKRLRKAEEAKKAAPPPLEENNPPAEASPAENAEPDPPAEAAKPKAPSKPRKRASRKKPEIDLTDEQMARLRKMAPGSRQKLLNTLAHLKVANAEATAVALIAHKAIEILPDNHVNWLAE